uniref:Uncharacterized protein n=1 Tax=Avena sativa TaxID=4498 RepID=A0ACD5ULP2_AVESA
MDDRLSALPDDLLLQILMLLPLIQLVQTTVLSRRWSRLWMEAQILHVIDKEVDGGGDPDRFEGVVDGILSVYASRLGGRAGCNFQISISKEDNIDIDRLNSWARQAAELFGGNFILSVETVKPADSEEDESDSDEELENFELPCFEFAKKITLTLSDRLLCLALPTSAGVFASLTHLVLMKLRFADGAGAALSEIVSSRCPCLLSLVVQYVQGVTALTLRTASLTHLNLSYVQGLRLLDVVALKLIGMTVQCCFVDSNGAELRISAPLLLRVEWADCCPESTQVGPTYHLKTLVVGEIPPLAWGEGFIAHSNFDMILRHFRRTHVLELHVPIRPELQGHGRLMEHIVLPEQYTDLDLVVEPSRHMFGMSMFQLLKRCIGIRMLHLKLSKRKGDTACSSSCIWDNPPGWKNQEIRLNTLHEILVSDFNDKSHEVDVVSFILKCAPSLQHVGIKVGHHVSRLSQDTILQFNKYHPVKFF